MNAEFIEALRILEKEKGIDVEILLEAIEAALISAYKKNFGSSQNVRVEIDRHSGDIHVYYRKEVVEHIEDERTEISLEEAQKHDPEFELGDVFESEVTPKSFGRIAAQTAKHVVVQRIREAERNMVYDQYMTKVDEVINATVLRQENKNIYVELGKSEALLAPSEQIPNEKYYQGYRMKVYVLEVKKTTKGPQVMVSRSHPGLLKRLFEWEVPEIHDGTVEIKSVVREPGMRSKIAVYSKNENVDPVGACVGAKGMRVQNVVNELGGEKIEIIHWDEDPANYVSNALSPAKVISVRVNEGEKFAQIIVPDFQLSLAIGKEGQNVRLAARLTGWKIDIKSQSQAELLHLFDDETEEDAEDAFENEAEIEEIYEEFEPESAKEADEEESLTDREEDVVEE